MPTPVFSIHNTIAAHVSHVPKQKIISGQYIDLALLLENTTFESTHDQKLVLNNGELIMRPRPTDHKINSIEKWTDAFIIFLRVYGLSHPEKMLDLVKYMHTIRLGGIGFGLELIFLVNRYYHQFMSSPDYTDR